MSDAGWAAIASMFTAFCSMVGLLFARQAREQSRENKVAIDENTERLDSHEAASAERGREVKAALAPVPLSGKGDPSRRPDHDFLIP